MASWCEYFPDAYNIKDRKNNIVSQCQQDKALLFHDNIDFRVNIMIWRAMKCIPYAVYMRNTYPGFCRVYMSCLFRSALKESKYKTNDGTTISPYDPSFSGEIREQEFAYKILSPSSVAKEANVNGWLGNDELYNMTYDDGDEKWQEIRMGYYQYVLACVQILHHGTFRTGKNNPIYFLTNKKKTNASSLDVNDLVYLLNLNMLYHPNNSEILLLCGWDVFFEQYIEGLGMMTGTTRFQRVVKRLKELNPWKIPGQNGYPWPDDWRDIWTELRPINCILNDLADEGYNPTLKNSWVEFELGHNDENWADNVWLNQMNGANIRWSLPEYIRRVDEKPRHYKNGVTVDGFNRMEITFKKRIATIIQQLQDGKTQNEVEASFDKKFETVSWEPRLIPFTPETITNYKYLVKGVHPLIAAMDKSGRTMSGAIQSRKDTKLKPDKRAHTILSYYQFTDKDVDELEQIRHLVSGGEGLPPMLGINKGNPGARNSRLSKLCIEAAHTSVTVKSVIWTAANYVISKIEEYEQGPVQSSKLYQETKLQLYMIDEMIQSWNETPYMFMPLGMAHYFVDAFDQCIECFKTQGYIEWIATNGVPKLIKDNSIPQMQFPKNEQLKIFWSELICYAIFGGSTRERTFWMPKPIDTTVKLEPMAPEELYRVITDFFPNYNKFKTIDKYKSTWSQIIICALHKIFNEENKGSSTIQLTSQHFNREQGLSIDWKITKDNEYYCRYNFEDIEKFIRTILLNVFIKTFIPGHWGGLDFVTTRRGYVMDEKCYLPIMFKKGDPDEIFTQHYQLNFDEDWLKEFWKQKGRQLNYSKSKTKSLLMGSRHPCLSFQLLDKNLDNWLEILPTATGGINDGNGITVLEKYLRPFWQWPYPTRVSKTEYANKYFMSKAEFYNILTEWSAVEDGHALFGIDTIFKVKDMVKTYTNADREKIDFMPYELIFYSKKEDEINNNIPILNIPEVLYAYDRWYVQEYMFLEERIKINDDIICDKGIDPFRRLDINAKRRFGRRQGRIKFNSFPQEFHDALKHYIKTDDIKSLKEIWNEYHGKCGPISPFSRCLLGSETKEVVPRPVRGFEHVLLSIIGLSGGIKPNFEPRRLAVGIYEAMSHENNKVTPDFELLKTTVEYNNDLYPCIHHGHQLIPYDDESAMTINILIPIRSFISFRNSDPNYWYVQYDWKAQCRETTKSHCQPVDILLKIKWPLGLPASTVFVADYMGQEEGIITSVESFESKNGYVWDWCNTCIQQMNAPTSHPPPNKIVYNANQSNLHPMSLIAFYLNFGVKFAEKEGGGKMMMESDSEEDLEMPFKNLKLKF